MTLAERKLISRAAAGLILVLLLVAIWIGPVSTYLDILASGNAAIAEKQALLLRYRGLAEARSPVPSTAPGETDLLYPAIPDAQAIALLQETVKTAAAAARIEVRGLQVMRVDSASGPQRIAIRVSGSGDIGSLSRLLHAVEAARPLLYPDNLQVQARTASPTAAPTGLEFQIDISGFKAGAAS